MLSRCPTCATPVDQGQAVCPACGSLTAADGGPTIYSPEILDALSEHPRGGPPESRFVAGTLLAGRYRVVGLLGRGGMGEVYRADDLRLGQTVALKFLPAALAADGAALARFHREVSFARQVSHPGVCRVFDVGEVEGRHYLTMEFIDGEDLASLLRRIGRLPPDKALEISRQLCAGLAAIHDSGLLHRDFKPANVMIDGRGRARIMDFGVAAVARELRGEAPIGTPAYMAPEQRTGGQTTVASDLFSLGLVMFETFTGRHPFPDGPPTESSSRPSVSGGPLTGMDSQTAAVILRCLERNPKKRPSSALRVAAALPGGDPLAEALAAGETPSPEMVAAATKAGELSARGALVLLACVIAGLAVAVYQGSRTSILHRIPFERSPEVLADRAKGLLAALGHGSGARDAAYGLQLDRAAARWVVEQETASSGREVRRRLAAGSPPLVQFWYRQSPHSLVPWNMELRIDDPPRSAPGEALAVLDTSGRLIRLEVEAKSRPLPAKPGSPPEWRSLLTAAGLDPSALTPATPRAAPPVYADARAAWTGSYPHGPGPPVPLRLEAAALDGRPVWLSVVEPWQEKAADPSTSDGMPALIVAYGVFHLAVLVTVLLLARRNLRLGRGDRKSAFRLALFVFSTMVIGWVAGGHHGAVAAEFDLLYEVFGWSLANAFQLWAFYMGLEPPLRRRLPETIITWSRLLTGNVRDPLVGRDVLIGCGFGLAASLLYAAEQMITESLGGSLALRPVALDTLLGAPGLIRQLADDLFLSILMPLIFVVFLLLLRLALPRASFGVAILWAILTLVFLLRDANSLLALGLAFAGLKAALSLFVWVRYGLLAGAVGQLVRYLCVAYPLTFELSAWYADVTVFVVVAVLGLAFFGFVTAVAGQPLLPREILDDE
jgi:serine/threonine-protein kinase